MSKHKYGYYASNDGKSPKGVSFNSISSYDFETGYKDSFTLTEFDAVGEPIFVPKNQNSDEGQGFLIALAYLGKENRSDLMVFDAENISNGPLARGYVASSNSLWVSWKLETGLTNLLIS